MNDTSKQIAELVGGVGDLVSLPDVFIRINQLVEDPDSSHADIVKVISQDPSFTVRLLRIANSPYYGFSSTIETVARAVTLIGTSQIRNLALSTAVGRAFEGLPNELVSMDNFWHHSLYCALIARMLAKSVGKCDPEALFTAGLLHDIGELVIFNRLPGQAKESLLLVLDSGDTVPVHEAERTIMGFDHAEVGGELARQWRLPPLLEECIAFHHDVARAEHFRKEAAIVHTANVLALMAEVDSLDVADFQPIDPLAWEMTGLTASEMIEPLISEAQAEIIEAKKLFFGN
jgi:putative nucleotidyltransferase with HDIG domain